MENLLMPSTNINNLAFYYEIHGEGFPLVLISGLSCDSTHWELVRGALAAKFKVISFDNRSVGRTQDAEKDYKILDMAKDVVNLLQYLKIDSAHIIGHSMGGAIAQTIAHQFPNYVNKLIISNSLTKFSPHSKIWANLMAEQYRKNAPVYDTVSITAPWVFSDTYLEQENAIQGLVGFALSHPYPQSAKGFAQQVTALNQFDSGSWLNQIDKPTLVIAGEDDYLTPLKGSTFIHQQIANSKLIVKEGAHVPMIEMPDEYVKDVLQFLLNT